MSSFIRRNEKPSPCTAKTKVSAIRGLFVAAGAIALLAPVFGHAVGDYKHGHGDGAGIEVISTRPDMVSGGDALIRIDGKNRRHKRHFEVWVNGNNQTSAFKISENGELLGKVNQLAVGKNRVRAIVDGRAIEQWIVNHPNAGPIFSGPHQQPFVCETQAAGLGAPLDSNCSAATQVSYRYISTNAAPPAPTPLPNGCSRLGTKQLCDLPDPQNIPGDIATTVTKEGKTVPYVIRLERGTINRAIYEIAILHDGRSPLSNPWQRADGWNGRLVYTFGGGSGAGYRQSITTGGVLNDLMLSQGYAVASATFNVGQNNFNDVLSAETALMVKEHFIEKFGEPRYTIGWGGSGGAMQQHLITQNYPGILDGITPSLSFSDNLGQSTGRDSSMLAQYWTQRATVPWTVAQRDAVAGWGPVNWSLQGPAITDTLFPPFAYVCPAVVVAAYPQLIYHPQTNPQGPVRCTLVDNHVNSFGIDPDTGYAYQPMNDNIGVQYGLRLLNGGSLSIEQFLDLNKHAGSMNRDLVLMPGRYDGAPANRTAVSRAYARGRINSGGGGLRTTPIIDHRPYTDRILDFHPSFHSLATRERLKKANGHADNQVILVGPAPNDPTLPANQVYNTVIAPLVLAKMDEWLANIEAAPAWMDAEMRVIKSKPNDLKDGCWKADGTRIEEKWVFRGSGQCNVLYPHGADINYIAGAPVTIDNVKCHLKTPDPRDYAVKFTSVQWQQLRDIFPYGVCDYKREADGRKKLKGTWLRYGPTASLN